MRRRATAGLLGALAACALVGSTGAAAADLPFHLPSSAPKQLRTMVRERVNPVTRSHSFHPVLHLKAKGGYTLAVLGDGNHVLLEVTRPHTEAVAAYVARGVVTRDRIEATFGTLGRLEMHFRPNSRDAVTNSCRSHRLVQTRQGVFVGHLTFDGENGYLGVDTRRVRGHVSRVLRRCGHFPSPADIVFRGRPGNARNNGPVPRILLATWRAPLGSAGFLALELFGKTLYLAITESSQEGLAVIRIAFAIGEANTFKLDDALTTASLVPPAPFHGRGNYSAAPDGTRTWDGSLSVNFPGAPRDPLTGPPFEVELAAGFEH